jgi:hypothetical protein
MNADMLNRGTEDRPPSLSLSLFFSFIGGGGGGGRTSLPPALDPPLSTPRFMQKRTRNLNEW